MDALSSWGLSLVHALQHLSPGLDGVMRFFSFLGEENFFSAFIAVVYWCVDATLGIRLLTLLVFSNFINGLGKWVFRAPRPYWIDARVKGLSIEPSYGLPSGHAQNAAGIWWMVAGTAGKAWARVAAVLLILAISVSRVYLGVHFPLDVIAGWVIGIVLLAAYIKVEPGAVRWLSSRSPATGVAAALVLSLAMLGVVIGVRTLIAGSADPPGWEATAVAQAPAGATRPYDPRGMDGPVADVGLVFGAGAGLALRRRYAPFDAGGPWGKRIARLALGLVVLAAMRFGLGALFPREPLAVGLLFRYVRYALMALGALWLAPRLFLTLKLAEKELGT